MNVEQRIRDATFPGIALALDPVRMRDLLSDALPECRDGLAVEDVRIFQVQYRPRKRCSVLYSVKFRRPGGRSRNQLLAAELLEDGRQPMAVDEALVRRYRQSVKGPLRLPVVHVPAAGLVAFAFPLDPLLPGLVDACDPEGMKSKLGRMWKERGVRLRQVTVKPLGFTPGARAALLYETLSECRTTGLPEVRRLVGKIDVQRDAAELFARNWSIWKETHLRFRMPPPVGYLVEPNVFLQEQVDGERLSELAGTGDFIGPVRQTARAVAVLHEMTLPLRFRRASLQSVKAVRRWARMLAAIRPLDRARIEALGDRLTAELEHRAVVTGPIHADLHPSNMLVDDGQVVLIDFDNMVLGDRLLDVGRFMSALRTSSLRVTGRPDGLADASESFLERYLSHTGEDERRARLFEAAALMISAGTGFRLQRDGWEQSAGWLLEECERNLALACAVHVGPPADAPLEKSPRSRRRPTPEAMKRRDAEADQRRGVDRLAWAGDPQYVRGLLAPHVRRLFDAELSECAVESKGPQHRREHLRYRLSGWHGEERWKTVLDGFLWQDRSGRSQSARLAALRQGLEGIAAAPRVPRPVAFLRELGLQVVELPRGAPLITLIDRPDAEEIFERFGRALAVLHRAPASLDKSRPAAGELPALRTAAAALEPAGRATVTELLDRIEPLLLDDLSHTGPTLRHLSPRRVLVDDGHFALDEIEDVVRSHPFLDAADFLTRLTTLDAAHDRTQQLAASFRRGYLAARPQDTETLAAFEALALLRGAIRVGKSEAGRERTTAIVRPLLNAAVARVAAAGARES